MQVVEKVETSRVSNLLTGETTPLEALENRLDRYAKAKARSESVQEYIITLLERYPQEGNPAYNKEEYRALQKLRDSLKECGSFLLFRHYYTLAIHKLTGGCSCKRHLLCMLCAIRRSAKQMQAYHQKVMQVMSDNPDQKLILVTLTVKNSDDLRERYKHLTKCLRVLNDRRKNLLSGCRKQNTVFSHIKGAVWTIETTNNGNGWHPHCHMLALVDKDLNVEAFQEMLTKEWVEISGDSYIVDARPIQVNDDDWQKPFNEVFKYTLKTNDMSVENQYMAYRALSGKRLISSIGSLYGVEVTEEFLDDIGQDVKGMPYEEILFRYSKFFGYQEWERTIIDYKLPSGVTNITKHPPNS